MGFIGSLMFAKPKQVKSDATFNPVAGVRFARSTRFVFVEVTQVTVGFAVEATAACCNGFIRAVWQYCVPYRRATRQAST